MTRTFITIIYILTNYTTTAAKNLNVQMLSCYVTTLLFLWRQEDTSSLRLISDERSVRKMIKFFSLTQILHLLLELF